MSKKNQSQPKTSSPLNQAEAIQETPQPITEKELLGDETPKPVKIMLPKDVAKAGEALNNSREKSADYIDPPGIEPRIGKIVLVGFQDREELQHYPGIIVKTHKSGACDISVFREGFIDYRIKVPFSEEKTSGTYQWPKY